MRVAALLALLALAACAPQDRIYEAHELDEPPVLLSDSLVFEAPAPTDTLRLPSDDPDR